MRFPFNGANRLHRAGAEAEKGAVQDRPASRRLTTGAWGPCSDRTRAPLGTGRSALLPLDPAACLARPKALFGKRPRVDQRPWRASVPHPANSFHGNKSAHACRTVPRKLLRSRRPGRVSRSGRESRRRLKYFFPENAPGRPVSGDGPGRQEAVTTPCTGRDLAHAIRDEVAWRPTTQDGQDRSGPLPE